MNKQKTYLVFYSKYTIKITKNKNDFRIKINRTYWRSKNVEQKLYEIGRVIDINILELLPQIVIDFKDFIDLDEFKDWAISQLDYHQTETDDYIDTDGDLCGIDEMVLSHWLEFKDGK